MRVPDLDEISLEEFLVAVIAVLRETGVKVDRGLDDRELARAEAAVGCTFPA